MRLVAASAGLLLVVAAQPSAARTRCPDERAARRDLELLFSDAWPPSGSSRLSDASRVQRARPRARAAAQLARARADAVEKAVLAHLCGKPDAAGAADFVRGLAGTRESPVPVGDAPDATPPNRAVEPLGESALLLLQIGDGGRGGRLSLLVRGARWNVATHVALDTARSPSVVLLDRAAGAFALLERGRALRMSLYAVAAGTLRRLSVEEDLGGGELVRNGDARAVRWGRRQYSGAPEDAPRLWYEDSLVATASGLVRRTRPLTPWLDAWRSFVERGEPVAFPELARLQTVLPRRHLVTRVEPLDGGVRLHVRALEAPPACDTEAKRTTRELVAQVEERSGVWVVAAIDGGPSCAPAPLLLSPGWQPNLPDGPRVLAAGQTSPVDVALDADSVYWLEGPARHRRALRVPKPGGAIDVLGDAAILAPQRVAPSEAAIGTAKIAVAAGRATWVTDAGGAVVASSAGRSAGGRFETGWPAALATDGTEIFWTDIVRHTVRRLGGAADVLAPLRDPFDIAADSAAVYVTTRDGRVHRIERDGRKRLLFEPVDPGDERPALTVDAGRLYWVRRGAGTVLSMPTSGGLATVIASGRAAPCDVAVGGGRVLFVECGAARIASVPAGAPMPVPPPVVHVECPAGPRALAADAAHLYWTTPAAVLRAPLAHRGATGLHECEAATKD